MGVEENSRHGRNDADRTSGSSEIVSGTLLLGIEEAQGCLVEKKDAGELTQ